MMLCYDDIINNAVRVQKYCHCLRNMAGSWWNIGRRV